MACLLATACHVRAQAPSGGLQAGPSMGHDPQVVTTLLKLLEVKDETRPADDDFTRTALKDLLTLGTPAGYHLRNRYIHLGVSLSQALAVTDDPRLKSQLVELARWERNPEIRAVALIALATRKEAAHLPYFREALVNIQPELRFASLEALEIWDLPGAKEEFVKVARQDMSPIVKVYAAQALLKRGDPDGREVLVDHLRSGDWVARAMAARYLGDLGSGEDYDRLLDQMTREQDNDFVTAECAIAALKLFPRKRGNGP